MALDSFKLYFARKKYPTHIARTEEELDAIARFRYSVYVEELGFRGHPAADHDARKMLYDDDLAEHTWLLYSGAIDDLQGTLRLRVLRPGCLTDDMREEYSLDLFPDIDERIVSDVSGFMFARSARGTAGATMLTCSAVEIAAEEGSDVLFAVGAAGLLRAYQRLGFRAYGGRLFGESLGMQLQVPIVGMLDLEYLESIGSPAYHILSRVLRRGKLSAANIQPILDVIERSKGSVVSEAHAIEEEIEDLFADGPAKTLFDHLSEEMVGELSKGGHILSVAAGDRLIQEDAFDNVLYFILGGLFEVSRGGQTLAHMGVGETFGEVAFFRKSGRRSASVRALTEGRVLIVTRSVLDKMVRKRPTDACLLYEALCQVMVERIAER